MTLIGRPKGVRTQDILDFIKGREYVTWSLLSGEFHITEQALRYHLRDQQRMRSINHRGQYFTLVQFCDQMDEYGLCRNNGIVSSCHGNASTTVRRIVEMSEAGLTREELEGIVTISCSSILLNLIKRGEIARLRSGYRYLYFSADKETRERQIRKRGLSPHHEAPEPIAVTATSRPRELTMYELDEEYYLLRRLEMVRRVKSGEKRAKVAREMGCSPETVSAAYDAFEETGARGLIITRKSGTPYKLTRDVQLRVLAMKVRHPEWCPELIGREVRAEGVEVSDRSVRSFLDEALKDEPVKKNDDGSR